MSEKLAQLMSSLVPGDVLTISLEVQGQTKTGQAVLLRRGGGEDLYLSAITANGLSSRPNPYNPFIFDSGRDVLVDKDGDTYFDIEFERAAGLEEVKVYSAIPRLSETTLQVSDDKLKEFVKMGDPQLGQIIAGIIENGEAGGIDTQLALVAEHIELSITQQQLAALTFFIHGIEATSGQGFAIATVPIPSEILAVIFGGRCGDENCPVCSQRGAADNHKAH